MGLLFYPRGGSAHVARNLAATLPHAGWDVTILSGSVTLPDHPGDASAFYRGLDVRPVDMTRALTSPDPMAANPPMHPSYEDRRAPPTGSSRRSTTRTPSTRSPPGRARCSRSTLPMPTSCTSTT